MPKITRFDKPTCQRLRSDLEAYLAPFLAERGLTLQLGNAKYDSGMVRFVNSEFKCEVDKDIQGAKLRVSLQMHNIIKADDTRLAFESAQYVLEDYDPKRWKRPWIVKSKTDGKSYILDDVSAKVHFALR